MVARQWRGQSASAIGRLLALATISNACTTPAPSSSSPPPSSRSPESGRDDAAAIPFAARFDLDGVYHLDPALPLPSRPPGAVHLVAKGDEYDNKRAADPEHYAVTTPPADIADVRPMVEWEPMQALIFAYPSYAVQMDQATDTFVEIARRASDYGEVWVLVDGSQVESIFKQRLARAAVPADKIGTTIKFLRLPLDTIWTVDFGPLPLVHADGSFAFGDFRYYHDRPLDDAIPTLLGRKSPELGQLAPVTTYRMPLTTEGGTFQATTDGVCITSSRQIYNMSCYAGSCQDAILELPLTTLQAHPYALEMRGVLASYVGCQDLVVTHSITDDRTGHIDMYLKILDDDRVLVGQYREPFENDFQRENAALMDDNAAFLEAWVHPDGGRFQVVRLPMPGHRTVQDWFGTFDVPFTYINATFFNGLNLWPAYDFPEWRATRDEAEAIWQQVLPDMEHVWLDSEELSYQSGAIHCVTRTLPAKHSRGWVDDGACDADGMCSGADGGYQGVCALGGADDLCWGPQWLCACNDCRACSELVADTPCGAIGWRGCCDGGDVLFCDNARLKRLSCAGTGCGWDGGQGFYSCGLAGEDPSGEAPVACDCEATCDGRTCGDDGCGGSCGTCAAGERCVGGACRDDCAECLPGELGCDQDVAWRCVAGPEECHVLEEVDCAASAQVCSAGVCVDSAPPDPDPGRPDEVEIAPHTTDTFDGDPEEAGAETTAAAPRVGGGDAGCGAALGHGWLALSLLGLGLRRRGRRRA